MTYVDIDASTFGDGSETLAKLTGLAVASAGGPFDFISIVNPNSPTGTVFDLREFVRKVAKCCPNTIVWVDETYIDYAKASQKRGTIHSLESLVSSQYPIHTR